MYMYSSTFKSACHLLKNLLKRKIRIQTLCTQMEEIDETKLSAELLRRKPQEPKPEDCCGDGCKVCVYDLYDQELKIWRDECYLFLGYDIVKTVTPKEVNWMSPLYYTVCTLKKIKVLTKNCNMYHFKLPENTNLDIKLGQHLVLRGLSQDDTITRQYTPIKIKPTTFNVLIKVYGHGVMSKFVTTWTEGCQLDWRGPFGDFQHKKNTHSKLILLAAGTGIAPMIEVIQSILDDESDETRIQLFFSTKEYDEIIMKDLLNDWKSYWNFNVKYFLTKEKDLSLIQYGENVVLGRLSEADLSKEITRMTDTRVLICGTKDFNDQMCEYLSNFNFPNENVHVF